MLIEKPVLFLEDLLEILPLCLSDDKEIRILGNELLKTYDCNLFPLTMYFLHREECPILPKSTSKYEEQFLGKDVCDAFKREDY